MGKNSSISWTTHTHNCWWGCVEVSPACDNCYARTWAKRCGFDVWGKDAPRRFFGESHWAEPLKWSRAAQKAGERAQVFCMSMGDICERRPDLDRERLKLWPVIKATPYLDWLLLTKRPQEFRHILPPAWLREPEPNVWLMTTIESPEYYWRWHQLRMLRAAVLGISYEPALAPINLRAMHDDFPVGLLPDWIIAGDESGSRARPSQLEWYESLRDECERFGVAFHMKQLCTKGKPMDFPMFPERLQIRQMPEVARW